MAPGDKPHTPEQIDQLIFAEIPDPITNPELHAKVCKFMLHGPCGDLNANCPCMKDGECKQSYPKENQESSFLPDDGYPVYRYVVQHPI